MAKYNYSALSDSEFVLYARNLYPMFNEINLPVFMEALNRIENSEKVIQQLYELANDLVK